MSAPNGRPRRRLAPVTDGVSSAFEAPESFADQVEASRVLADRPAPPAPRPEQGAALGGGLLAPPEPPEPREIVDEDPYAHNFWPGANRTATTLGVQAATVDAVHGQIFADLFTALLLHNGIDSPGVVEFSTEGAQQVADYAAAVYRPFGTDPGESR